MLSRLFYRLMRANQFGSSVNVVDTIYQLRTVQIAILIDAQPVYMLISMGKGSTLW